jgi:hypothetical protein
MHVLISANETLPLAHITGQMAICCQNLTLGALSSHSALSVLFGGLFKKFSLFLNMPYATALHLCFLCETYYSIAPVFLFFVVLSKHSTALHLYFYFVFVKRTKALYLYFVHFPLFDADRHDNRTDIKQVSHIKLTLVVCNGDVMGAHIGQDIDSPD